MRLNQNGLFKPLNGGGWVKPCRGDETRLKRYFGPFPGILASGVVVCSAVKV